MSDTVGVVIAEAGVIGLAVTRTLAATGREALVLDRDPDFGWPPAPATARSSRPSFPIRWDRSRPGSACAAGKVNYHVDPSRKPAFLAAARAIWPEIDAERLEPGYAGIRPKLSGPGEPAAHFLISGPAEHGLDGLVNLLGIESPWLNSSLALAEEAAAHLDA